MNTLTLSPARVATLMRHDIVTQSKSILTSFAALAGVVIALFLFASASGGGSEFHTSLFVNILVIGGFVVSSTAFSELNDPKTRIHYLMLPGSSLEKYVAKLLLTSIGWTVSVVVLYIFATAVGTLLGGLFFATTPGVFLPTSRTIWVSMAGYLVSQSIFLFGSIYFRKVAFLKTALSAIVVAFSLGIVWVFATRLVFAPLFTGFFELAPHYSGSNPMAALNLEPARAQALARGIEAAGDLLTWIVAPIFFWVAGVLRLRETEV
ncbi:MAG: hypothetical protein ACOC7V_04670 [Spirochaetota bacterium]